jgi:hypothetical protein
MCRIGHKCPSLTFEFGTGRPRNSCTGVVARVYRNPGFPTQATGSEDRPDESSTSCCDKAVTIPMGAVWSGHTTAAGGFPAGAARR